MQVVSNVKRVLGSWACTESCSNFGAPVTPPFRKSKITNLLIRYFSYFFFKNDLFLCVQSEDGAATVFVDYLARNGFFFES